MVIMTLFLMKHGVFMSFDSYYGEPAGLSDEELLRVYGLAKRDHCYDGPLDDWPTRAERAATVAGLRAVEAATLARAQRQPAPPEPGEAQELVKWLREQEGWMGACAMYSRIADLLAQRYPQPVPVSERLPGPEDCDDQKRCWWLVLHQSWPCLYLMKADSELAAAVATHWLPAHALPLPGEVEG